MSDVNPKAEKLYRFVVDCVNDPTICERTRDDAWTFLKRHVPERIEHRADGMIYLRD